MRKAIAMPSPVPFAFVVKNGSKIRCCCSAVRPGPRSEIAIFAPQVERRCPLPDFFIESMEVLLGPLHASDQLESLRAIFDFQRQHFQTGLTPLQCIAAFVD